MKKRLLSFALALTVMVSLLSVMCPRTVYAESFVVKFALPTNYVTYEPVVRLYNPDATNMTNTGEEITIDGTNYTIYSLTTDTKPTKDTTYFYVYLNIPTCPAPTLAGSQTNGTGTGTDIPAPPIVSGVKRGNWYSDVDWQFGENIVAVPIDYSNKMLAGSDGTIKFVDISKYKVTFDVQGHGTAPQEQNVISGALAPQPSDPTETGFIFEGWYKEATCENKWNFETDTVTKNTTLYAKWTEAGTINVQANPAQNLEYNGTAQSLGSVGADVDGVTIQYKVDGSEYSTNLPKATDAGTYVVGYKVEKTGYTTVESTFNVKIGKCTPTLTLSSDFGSYAVPNSGTFTYAYDGDGIVSVSSDDPAKATASVNTATKTVTVTPVSLGTATITVAAGETNNYSSVSATYEVTVAVPYTVTFDTNGGTPAAIESQTVVEGNKVVKPADPTREGYTFEGWFRDFGEMLVRWDFDESVVCDITLVATWKKVADVPGTGDTNNVWLYVVIAALALGAMGTGVVVMRKKANR